MTSELKGAVIEAITELNIIKQQKGTQIVEEEIKKLDNNPEEGEIEMLQHKENLQALTIVKERDLTMVI